VSKNVPCPTKLYSHIKYNHKIVQLSLSSSHSSIVTETAILYRHQSYKENYTLKRK